MTTTVGLLLLLVFTILAALHFFWGLGGKWGVDSTLPQKEDGKRLLNTTSFHCFVVGTGLMVFGLLAGIRGGIIHFELPSLLSRYGLWVIAGIFLARTIGDFRYVGFFKRVRNTPFGRMDTILYSPLSFALGLLCVSLQFLVSSTL